MLNKIISSIFTILVICSFWCAACFSANVVTNPGFESGTTGWTTWGSVNTATAVQKHLGSYSCLSSGRTQYWQGPVQSIAPAQMTAGVTYKITGWVRMDNTASDDLAITIGYKVSGGADQYWATPSVTAINTAWTSITGYFTMPANVTTLNLYCSEATDSGARYNFYLDDVLVEVAQGVNIDLSSDMGDVTHLASGFLFGVSATEPASTYFETLKPQLIRFRAATTGDQWGTGTGFTSSAFMNRISNILHRQVVLSDEYQWTFGYHTAYGWPHDGNPTALNKLYDTITAIHNAAVSRGYSGYEWDIWNEPDPAWGTTFWGGTQSQFFNCWLRACNKIKTMEPSAVIVGPSATGYNEPYLQAFLLFCKANNCLPNILSWHELNQASNSTYPWISYKTIDIHAAAIKSWMIANSITPMPITINEYSGPDEATLPGRVAWYFASLEQSAASGVIASARACWTDNDGQNTLLAGRLDGIMTSSSPHKPRASWHLYKAYADMTGTMCQISPSDAISGVAAKNSQTGEVKIILGNETSQSKSVNIEVDDLNELPYFISGSVRVIVERVSDNGWTEVASPEPVSDSNSSPSGNALTLPLTFAANQAYIITLKYPCSFKSDLNFDCKVDFNDLMILASDWLK